MTPLRISTLRDYADVALYAARNQPLTHDEVRSIWNAHKEHYAAVLVYDLLGRFWGTIPQDVLIDMARSGYSLALVEGAILEGPVSPPLPPEVIDMAIAKGTGKILTIIARHAALTADQVAVLLRDRRPYISEVVARRFGLVDWDL